MVITTSARAFTRGVTRRHDHAYTICMEVAANPEYLCLRLSRLRLCSSVSSRWPEPGGVPQ